MDIQKFVNSFASTVTVTLGGAISDDTLRKWGNCYVRLHLNPSEEPAKKLAELTARAIDECRQSETREIDSTAKGVTDALWTAAEELVGRAEEVATKRWVREEARTRGATI